MFQSLVNRLAWIVVKLLPSRTRMIYVDGEEYLLRFYIKHNGKLPGIYLHKFYRGDKGRDLHNHPWKWSASWILTGGYVEERWDEYFGEIVSEHVKPGSMNFIEANDFHRVHLCDEEKGAWTLFISGPEVQEWGFMDRETGDYIPHQDYIEHG